MLFIKIQNLFISVLLLDSIIPIGEIGYLEEFTELHIAPKSSSNRVMSTNKGNESENKLSIESLTHSGEKEDNYFWEKLKNVWAFFLGSRKRADNDVKSLSHYGNVLGFTRSSETYIYNEVHMDEVLRLHPFPKGHHKSNGSLSNLYNSKPFNLHTSSEFMNLSKSSRTCIELNERRIILKVSKNFSPKERDDEKRKQKKGGPKISLEPMMEKGTYFLNFCIFLSYHAS